MELTEKQISDLAHYVSLNLYNASKRLDDIMTYKDKWDLMSFYDTVHEIEGLAETMKPLREAAGELLDSTGSIATAKKLS